MTQNQKQFIEMMIRNGYTPFYKNEKPFWKEKSLKAVWRRINHGARFLIYAAGFVAAAVVAILMVRL